MKKNILIKNHQPRFREGKKKGVVLIPTAAFEVLSLYSHDNESGQYTHFSKTFDKIIAKANVTE